MTVTSRFRAVALFVLMLPLPLAGCSSFYGPGVSVSHTSGQNTPLVTDDADSDDALGAQEHPKIVASHGGIYSDRPAEIMLARVVGRLLGAAGQPDTRFTLTILDTAEDNAFALPGGYIYVTRGLLALANDTSEIAAVLSHEIAHVTLKHARARINRVRTSQIVDQVVTDVFGGDVETDQSANRSKLALAAFSQAQELAADKQGILTSGRAGYDPQSAAEFLGIMSRFSQFSVGDVEQADDFLSSHPSTPDRIQKALETAHSFFDSPNLGETDRDGYLDAIDGLAFGDSPAQGAVVDQRYVNSVLGFTFTVPDRYTLQISNGAVVGVAGENEAVRFDSAEVPASTGLADYLKSGWIAGLQPETVRAENANGIDMATGVAVTPQWTFRVAVVRFKDQVYRFIFAAKFDSPAFDEAATQTLRSFRAATSRDSAGVKHLVLRLATAGKLDTADSLARKMSGLTRGTDLFYILNNLYPGDPVVPGQRYKIVSVE
jgi:predicted Zn-dependent protease